MALPDQHEELLKRLEAFAGRQEALSFREAIGIAAESAKLIRDLAERVERLEGALGFYADRIRYDGPNQSMRHREPDAFTGKDEPYLRDVTRDGGFIARAALTPEQETDRV